MPGTTKRVILDASFVRGTASDSRQLLVLADRGYRMVISDTLVWELLTASGANGNTVGLAALRKLHPIAEVAEMYEHTGIMIKQELETGRPFGNPTKTVPGGIASLLDKILNGPCENRKSIIEETVQSRECNTTDAIFGGLPSCAQWLEGLYEQILNLPIKDSGVAEKCRPVVNCPAFIHSLLNGEPSLEAVTPDWMTWHAVKSYLALVCDYVRQGETDFAEIQAKARKKWVNRMHDLDYLILLNWADAIASNETAGEQYAYRTWMYGNEKHIVTGDDCQ